jgi:hypothetical protein
MSLIASVLDILKPILKKWLNPLMKCINNDVGSYSFLLARHFILKHFLLIFLPTIFQSILQLHLLHRESPSSKSFGMPFLLKIFKANYFFELKCLVLKFTNEG